MPQLFTNNATSTLAADITNVATSLTVATGHGARFPAISGASDFFLVTLEKTSGTREIVRVTARSGDVLTITRAQEGTTAVAFATGDAVELRVTAATMTAVVAAVGAMREIATVTTSSSQSSVTFSGIPGTYRDLRVVANARGTAAATNSILRMQLNGDTGANYTYLRENRFGTAHGTAAFFEIGTMNAANSLSTARSVFEASLPDYASTSAIKGTLVQSNGIDGTASSVVLLTRAAGYWNSSAAITSLTFTVSANAFVDGSTFTLYGVGGIG